MPVTVTPVMIKELRERTAAGLMDCKKALTETDGDLVALHVHNRRSPELRGNAVVDIFRIENGKVVEHWDVVQAIPDPDKAKNKNSMF